MDALSLELTVPLRDFVLELAKVSERTVSLDEMMKEPEEAKA